MIKPEELRIGNWFTKDGEYHNVGHIQKNFYNTCVNNYGPENIEPIPLTNEILEACGFIHRQESFFHYYSKQYTNVAIEKTFELEYLDEKTYAWIAGNTIVHVSSLHQLQNLWYSLTGKELEVKLPQLV